MLSNEKRPLCVKCVKYFSINKKKMSVCIHRARLGPCIPCICFVRSWSDLKLMAHLTTLPTHLDCGQCVPSLPNGTHCPHCLAAWLPGCLAAGCPAAGCQMAHTAHTARLLAAWLPGCLAAGCLAARLPGCPAAGCPAAGCLAAGCLAARLLAAWLLAACRSPACRPPMPGWQGRAPMVTATECPQTIFIFYDINRA